MRCLQAIGCERGRRKPARLQHSAKPAHAAANVQHRLGGIAGQFHEQLGVACLRPRHIRQTDVFRAAGGIVEVAVMEKIAGEDLRIECQLGVVVRVPMGFAALLKSHRFDQMARA